jgi:uncharacterized membrane protein YczE
MRRLTHTHVLRLAQAVFGATVMGTGLAATYRARLGVQPWDVLHQALANLLGLTPGVVIIVVSVVVLAMWWPLRQKPGLGTVVCTVVPGLVMDRVMTVLPTPEPVLARVGLLAEGIVLFAIGTALLLRAGLGPGVRDGLMTGACARWGWSVRVVRTGLEVSVLLIGLAIAGPVTAVTSGIAGPGTLAVAVALGPLLQVLLGNRPTPAAAARSSRPALHSEARP